MRSILFPKLDKLPHPRKARDDAGKTQEQVRQAAGIGIMTVVRAEASGRWPQRVEVLERYLRAVGIAR